MSKEQDIRRKNKRVRKSQYWLHNLLGWRTYYKYLERPVGAASIIVLIILLWKNGVFLDDGIWGYIALIGISLFSIGLSLTSWIRFSDGSFRLVKDNIIVDSIHQDDYLNTFWEKETESSQE